MTFTPLTELFQTSKMPSAPGLTRDLREITPNYGAVLVDYEHRPFTNTFAVGAVRFCNGCVRLEVCQEGKCRRRALAKAC